MASRFTCPICASPSPVFLTREGVPVHQNLVLPDERSAINVTRGDLELAVCEACGFVFNAAFDLARMSYGECYDNTQTCSPTFEDYVDGLADSLVRDRGVAGCRIVEVGCGQGGFLRKLVERDPGNVGFGFDPAYRGPESDPGGRLQFRNCYYGPDHCDIRADVVVCRHTIEHVPDPMLLLRSVRQALDGSANARVFFETPCVEWILRYGVIWDLFYEHCSYFTADCLSHALESAGFEVTSAEHVFGGQYLWVEARVGGAGSGDPRAAGCGVGRPSHSGVTELAHGFAETETLRREAWRRLVMDQRERGGVALWGAGAKGVTFANVVDPDRSLIACVVDVNPNKQGRWLPGTGHPIVGPSGLVDRGVRGALVTNPNYSAEIKSQLAAGGLAVDLIDLMGSWPSPRRDENAPHSQGVG